MIIRNLLLTQNSGFIVYLKNLWIIAFGSSLTPQSVKLNTRKPTTLYRVNPLAV